MKTTTSSMSLLAIFLFLGLGGLSQCTTQESHQAAARDAEQWRDLLKSEGNVLFVEGLVDYPSQPGDEPGNRPKPMSLVKSKIGDFEFTSEARVTINRKSEILFLESDNFKTKTIKEEMRAVFVNQRLEKGLVSRRSKIREERVLLGIDKNARWDAIVAAVGAAKAGELSEVGFVFAQPSVTKTPAGFWGDERFNNISINGLFRIGKLNPYYFEVGSLGGDFVESCLPFELSLPFGPPKEIKSIDDLGDLSQCTMSADFELYKNYWWARVERQYGRPQKALVAAIAGTEEKSVTIEANASAPWSDTHKKLLAAQDALEAGQWIQLVVSEK
ncbi:hypothetical protein KAI87_10860 [Myxococcota bacterium]|nr:hypothetical protein [Myxococcota bacterium]